MKTIPKYLILIAILLIGLGSRPQIPPTTSDFVGVWIGMDSDYNKFYRLTLESNDKGSLILLHGPNEADKYEINWEYRRADLITKSRLLIRAKASGEAESIKCTVSKVGYTSLDFIIEGVSNRWMRNNTLFKETKFLQQHEMAATAAKEFDSKIKTGK